MHDALVPVLWLAWLAYWLISARNAKVTRRTESLASRLTHIVPLTLGVALMFSRRVPDLWLYDRVIPGTPAAYWTGIVVLVLGLAVTVWARLHLGRNWSGTITLKEDHELIRSGPYGLVRHPIYSGLLLAMLGTAIILGEWRGFIAFVLIVAALVRKLILEERWLAEIFPDGYARYRAQVPALVPFVI